jgi:hypothetical protein
MVGFNFFLPMPTSCMPNRCLSKKRELKSYFAQNVIDYPLQLQPCQTKPKMQIPAIGEEVESLESQNISLEQ